MGDNLAQELYGVFVAASGKVAGGEVPNWASLPSVEREVWAQIAARAETRCEAKFFAVVKEIEDNDDIDPLDELSLLRERFGRS